MTTTTVSNGVLSSGLSIASGDNVTVLSGGTAIVTTVSSGGVMIISGGGVEGETTLLNGAHEQVMGDARNDSVSSGGIQQVFSALGFATNTTIFDGGIQYVYDGGVASGGTVSSGGIEVISPGGSGIDMDVLAGGREQVFSGGIATVSSITTLGANVLAGGFEITQGTGVVTSAVASGSGTTRANIEVFSGGINSATQLEDESVEFVLNGGTSISATISSGGIGVVSSGGVASNTTVLDGGEQQVFTGGTTVSTTVNAGGTEFVGNGGVASSTTLISAVGVAASGGLVVNSGGSAVAAVASGGKAAGISILVSSGGTTTGTVLTGADETVNSGGVASGTTVSGGAQLFLNSGSSGGAIAGGSGFGTTVLSGGVEQVFDFAVESGGTIDAGGTIGVAGTIVGETVQFGGGATMLVDGNGAHGSSISAVDFGSVTISSGGAAIGDTVMSGGQEWVFGGGSATGVTVSGSGTFVVSGAAGSAAVASGTNVLAGGIETVFVSGTETGGTVSSGGEISVNGSMVDETILAGGNYFIGPFGGGLGLATSTTVFGAGHIESGSTEAADQIQAGGTDIVSDGGTASNTTISSGGTLQLLSGGTATDTILLNGGSIDVAYVPYVSGATAALNSSTDVLTVTDGGNTLTYQMTGTYTGDTFNVTSDTTGNTLVTMTACFCTGTRILTDQGEVAVERLVIGDRVATMAGTFRSVKWIGHRRMDFSHHPEPELVQPILIRTNAIAEGAPHRDLSLSPDHALLIDDVLVPARLLVNGGSIRSQSECRSATYYHVELDTHDILLAENLAAESYLDTGNRAMFENAGMPMLLLPDLTKGQGQRVAQSCRPFADDPTRVEPIWHWLAARSAQLGMPLPAPAETTHDPDLHIVIDEKTIYPANVQDGRYTFVLPATGSAIHLVSHATKPNALRPWVEDHRRLGVMICRLALKRGVEMREIPLDHPQLTDGWWATECNQTTLWRWTDGDAVVPVPRGGPMVLEVTLAETLAYPINGRAAAKAA